MANITLLGASYTDVPAIDLPQTGGGTVRFYENGGGGGTPAISVVDTLDSHGGTIREITALDISDTTAEASDVAQGKYFYTAAGVKTAGAGSSTPSATSHTIYFEFSDSTNTTITAYWDDSFISNAITATEPTTYGGKTVTLAQLDGVTWYSYTPQTETWETLYDGNGNLEADTPYPYFWISELSDVEIPMGSVWRITFDGTSYVCTATRTLENMGYYIGNAGYGGGSDDGTPVPLCLYNTPWGAWSGGADASAGSHTLKIERLVTS